MQVQVTWAPAFELAISLRVFLDRKGQKITDLGTAWGKEVAQRLSPDLAKELESGEPPFSFEHLMLLIRQCPRERSVDSFLDWYEDLTPSVLFDLTEPYLREGYTPLRAGWKEEQETVARLLRGWNEQYFAHLEPSLLTDLAAEGDARRDLVASHPAAEAIEHATNGVLIAPDELPVTLIPQYHYRPINIRYVYRDAVLMFYGAEQVGLQPDQTPPHLLRVTRALSDESRLRILRYLADEPRTFTDVVKFTGLALSTVHHHLVALRAAGLLRHIDALPGGNVQFSLRETTFLELGDRLLGYLKGSR